MYKLVSCKLIMTDNELITACIKNDKAAQKLLFERFYGKLGYIGLRYCKNSAQAEDVSAKAFIHLFQELPAFKNQSSKSVEEFLKEKFIEFIVKHIKGIRNEYYVASTVKANENKDYSYDLFLDSGFIDLKSVNQAVLLKSIQSLVPSQRLVFNLHVIDNYTLETVSELLETSLQTIKSNLEKARFNLQKAIENNLKSQHNEQPV